MSNLNPKQFKHTWNKEHYPDTGETHYIHKQSGNHVFNTYVPHVYKWQVIGGIYNGTLHRSLKEAKRTVEQEHEEKS